MHLRTSPRPRRAPRALLAASTLSLLSIAGCFGSGNASFAAAAGIAKPGEETVIVFDRLVLTIPAGAVAEPTPIRIERRKLLPATHAITGFGYVLTPTDLTFAQAATLTYRFFGIPLPEPTVSTDLFLARLGPSLLATPLPSNTIDVDEAEASAELSTLGTVALLGLPIVPPDNGAGEIVFLRAGAGGLPDLWRAAADGSGEALVSAHLPGEQIATPRVSSVAGRAAFTETVGGGTDRRAWIVGLDGSGRTLVTADASDEVVGDLSADGLQLYVSRTSPGSATSDLVVYDLSAGPPFASIAITTSPDDSERDPRLSPDGTILLFRDGEGRLARRSPTPGGEETLVTAFPVDAFAWRPDGLRAVVQRPLFIGGGLGEVNPKSKVPLPGFVKGTAGAGNPAYSPNGLFFLFEILDPDPSILAPTLRQISRKGALGSMLLGGAQTPFPGQAPNRSP